MAGIRARAAHRGRRRRLLGALQTLDLLLELGDTLLALGQGTGRIRDPVGSVASRFLNAIAFAATYAESLT